MVLFFGGPNNLKKLSGILNKEDLYETLYRDFSGIVHSNNILDKNIIASENSSTIVALRSRDDIKYVSVWSAHFFWLMIDNLIEHRYADKKDEFMNWWSRYKIHYNKLFVTV